MPRRKKNGQSPARVPSGPPEGGNLGHNTGYRLPQGLGGAMASNFRPSTSLTSSAKEEIVKSMQEMFSHLDPDVIHIVLSECDFKVEDAMDSLLELSVAAESAAPIPSVSGFERTAAELLSPSHFSEPRLDPESSRAPQLPSSPPSTNLLTGELDLLVDQELETLTTKQGIKEEHQSHRYLSPFPPPPIPQQALPELLQSSLQSGSRDSSCGLEEHISGASSLLDQLSTWEDKTAEDHRSVCQSVDFTHLMAEMPADKPRPPLDLAASGRPSAFQVYKKQDPSHTLSDKAGVMPPTAIVGGARSKVNMLNQEPPGYIPSPWNLKAPVFSPRIYGNQGPAFITPVAQMPSNWPSQHRHASPWLGAVSQAPLKPSATIPKSWALPTPQPPAQYNRLRLEGKVLVLLRGAPGSGKSTLARALAEHNPGGVQLSTDDYFIRHGEYQFDPTALGEAHEWNHNRAKEAFERRTSPIIIDNTNMQAWEMRPYVVQALKHGYKVLFREPDTWWKNKPRELARRTTHNVPVETIRRMLSGYERFVTVQSIMGSQMPELKQRLQENKSSQQVSSEAPCPDLVGQPGLTEGCKKSHPQLFSSLPDVSSIGRSTELDLLEDGTHKSTESLNFQPIGSLIENPKMSDRDNDMDLGELDSELDAHLEINQPVGEQKMPDCIVESIMNEDHSRAEIPVAFSETIGQRVRRERQSRRSGFDCLEPADLVKDTNQSESEAKAKEKTKEEEAEVVEMAKEEVDKGMPKLLDFLGDWPSEGSLGQRQVRRRKKHKEGNGNKDEGLSQETNESKTKVQSGPMTTEFQKLLDLIQTGVAPSQTGSSCSSSISLSSGGDLEREEEAGGNFGGLHDSRSNSEERDHNTNRHNSTRGELPDCVLDWKAADSFKIRELRNGDSEGIKNENEARSKTEGNDEVMQIGRVVGSVDLRSTNPINPSLALAADSLVISKTAEAPVCHDGVGSQNIKGEVVTELGTSPTDVDTDNCTENDSESRVEAECSHVSEVCQSPMCEDSGETESSSLSASSQEKKQRQGRRSGKQCKLALTFTQNCPASSLDTLECLSTPTQNINSSQSSINTDFEPNFNPNCKTSLNHEPNIDLSNQSKSETHLQPPSPFSLVDEGCPTQTEPQDFALLWRLNHQDNPCEKVVATCSQPSDIIVLSGDSSRFVPQTSSAVSAAIAIHSTSQREVPYRVVHEKGTQVEEKELGAIQDRLESLSILSRHFKLVSFDTLEDLYDKCHQDLEWTTNLLLDSGERFFRDEDGEKKEEDGAWSEKDQNTSSLYGEVVEARICPILLNEHEPEDQPNNFEERTQQSTFETVRESDEVSNNADILSSGGAAVPVINMILDTTAHLEKSPQTKPNLPQAVNEGETHGDTEHQVASEVELEAAAWAGTFDDGVIIEDSRVETEEEIASMDKVHRLLQAELDELEREERQREEERTQRRRMKETRSQHLNIQSVELKLSTEVALQLTELFGPVGVDPGACSTDDYVVQMDLNLAKLLYQKWKETIQKKQREATLAFHLLGESSGHWGESQVIKPGQRNQTQSAPFLISADGYASLDSQPEANSQMPFMDHWNVSRPHISLRDIIKEEQALQHNAEKTRRSRADLDRRDGAALLKENQLYSLFPTIDRHFLQDIFRDHNYNLNQTELFLRSLLDEEPVKTVVAPEPPPPDQRRAASKEREKKQKPQELIVPDYQDTEDPEYEDFRAEASLQRTRQLESFSKAAEAFKQGRKEVASFYAQQGHLHGRRMREANHRAAVQIFERVNSSLLPNNILDLHGLHVDEALEHLAQVLQDKTTDCEQGLCRPQLSVITGRGNHSQGGVARIRPAVIDYLTNNHYRFTEPKPGLVLVSLK